MGYAVRNDNAGWRSVNSKTDIDAETETYQEQQPIAKEPVLADRQSAMWNKIKAERSIRMSGGSKVDNKWFHADQDSRLQHLGLKDSARDLLAAGAVMSDAITINGQQVAWKTMDGTFAPMTLQLAFDIVEADKALDASLFIAAETHRLKMLAATDPDAYDYSTGWPERFAA